MDYSFSPINESPAKRVDFDIPPNYPFLKSVAEYQVKLYKAELTIPDRPWWRSEGHIRNDLQRWEKRCDVENLEEIESGESWADQAFVIYAQQSPDFEMIPMTGYCLYRKKRA